VSLAGQPSPGLAEALRRRARAYRLARLGVLAAVIGWFFLPYGVKTWIPAWLVFVAAVLLEAEFFFGGWLQTRRPGESLWLRSDRGPQARDLDELGGSHWREQQPVDVDGVRRLVPSEWLSGEEDDTEQLVDYLSGPEEPYVAPEPDAAAGHPYRRYVLEALAAVAVVAAILLVASRPQGWSAVSSANRARAEAVFSREAARIAGHPARVRCDTSGRYVGYTQDADGLAYVGGSRAYLTPGICNTLYQLAFKHRVQSFPQTAHAIAVLGHESQHLRGVANEGLANCYGFQSGVRIGTDLGLSEHTAHAMMREELATNPQDSSDPRYLVPAGCRNGGAYDLNPGRSSFP
jgi:hypothetical protein